MLGERKETQLWLHDIVISQINNYEIWTHPRVLFTSYTIFFLLWSCTLKPPNRTQMSWHEARQYKQCLACNQNGVCTNMQLLLLSIKLHQKNIVLKNTGQIQFNCEVLFFLSISTLLYSPYYKGTLVAWKKQCSD